MIRTQRARSYVTALHLRQALMCFLRIVRTHPLQSAAAETTGDIRALKALTKWTLAVRPPANERETFQVNPVSAATTPGHYFSIAYSALASLKMGMSESRSASCRLGVEEDFWGFEKYLLLPAKYLRRERRAYDKRHDQCCHVARVRPPRVAPPNPFEQ